MIDFQESDEQRQARRDVLTWWKGDCGWGKLEEIAAPIITDGPGVFAESKEVEESPSRKRSHHKIIVPHKCADCVTMVSGSGERCPDCRKVHRRGTQVASHARVHARNKAGKFAARKV